MVDSLVVKTQNWEDERGVEFLYDGVSILFKLLQLSSSNLKTNFIVTLSAYYQSDSSSLYARGIHNITTGEGT